VVKNSVKGNVVYYKAYFKLRVLEVKFFISFLGAANSTSHTSPIYMYKTVTLTPIVYGKWKTSVCSLLLAHHQLLLSNFEVQHNQFYTGEENERYIRE
jgi:hypothetical protein